MKVEGKKPYAKFQEKYDVFVVREFMSCKQCVLLRKSRVILSQLRIFKCGLKFKKRKIKAKKLNWI